jgi:hypothetical protein
MSDEKVHITEKGIDVALVVLEREGYLTQDPHEPLIVSDYVYLNKICLEYMEASKAKGDARTQQEEKDGILIAYFQAFLEDTLKKVN